MRARKILPLCAILLAPAACLLAGLGRAPAPPSDSHLFGIYTARLDGSDVKTLLTDPNREMNHARVSPDRQWVTFTRYNRRSPGGLAVEAGGYEESEIMLCQIDGSSLRSLVPPERGKVAANGYWTPNGRNILFVSNDNPERRGEIHRIEIAGGRISRVDTPAGLLASDPHQVGERMTFAVYDSDKTKNNEIWIMSADGGGARALTHPRLPVKRSPPPLGDFDPKLSPDGRTVAFMRQVAKDNWHVVLAGVESGRETDLSPSRSVDGVPEWSSDGRKLIFWHVDTRNIRNSGLYTMSTDGSARQRIPLPRGHFYTMPAFFPHDGSGPDARIIYSAKKEPAL